MDMFFPLQNLTYEIILTLGQAFEVAYQLALQAQRTNQKQKQSLVGRTESESNTRSSRPMPKPRGGAQKPGVSTYTCAYINSVRSENCSYVNDSRLV